jgi:acyl-coenzyme A thioesterase PaaI-like protein
MQLDPQTLERLLGVTSEAARPRAALHALVATLRDLAALTVTLDSHPEVDAAVAALAAPLERVVSRLAALPRVDSAATADLPMSMLPERSPVSGRANVVAPPVRYRIEAGRTLAEACYGAHHEGPAGGVHGGIVAATFDEILGVAQIHAGVAGYTVELDVRYHAITPLHRTIRYEAAVESRHPRRLVAVARSTDEDGRLLADARGTFAIREEFGDRSGRDQP